MSWVKFLKLVGCLLLKLSKIRQRLLLNIKYIEVAQVKNFLNSYQYNRKYIPPILVHQIRKWKIHLILCQEKHLGFQVHKIYPLFGHFSKIFPNGSYLLLCERLFIQSIDYKIVGLLDQNFQVNILQM